MKRPNKPAASANPGRSWPPGRNEESRFTVTGRGQTAKAFLPAPNALSSLKSVTTTLRGWCADPIHPHFHSGWQLGDAFVFPPLQPVHSPPACRMLGDIAVSLLQCTEPVPATRQPSTSLSAIRARTPRAFLHGGGCRCFQAFSTPHLRYVFPCTTLWFLCHTSFTNGSVYPGYRCGFSANSKPVTLFSLGKIPPFRRGSPDSSKQRRQGFCSTTGTFLPPAERSNRGSTADGSRTRFLQPLLPRSKEGRRLEAYPGSTAFESFPLQREVQNADDENHHVSGSGGRLVCHHRPEGCVFSHPGRSQTQEIPSVRLWREGLPIQGSALRPGFGPEDIYQMHGCCTGPFEAPGHPCTELSGRLAHSGSLQGASESSQDIVLGHIHSLGLRMNAKKSVLLPSQRTVFLGVRLDSVQMQARLAPARIPVFTACLARFKLDHHVSVGTCRRLLGLMAAASPVLPLGLLHMRPFLWWMKELRLHPTVPATRLVRVSRSCCRHLLMWRDPSSPERGENGCDPPSPYDHDGRINDRLGRGLRRKAGEWRVEGRVPLLAYKLPGTQGCLPGFEVFSPRSRGASCHSQDGQYGGCVPHKPPRRFKVAHPGQACAPSSPLVPRQVPLLRAVHVPGSTEPGGRFSVETEAQAGGMDVEPSDGIPRSGICWQSGGGPLASQESSQCPLWFSLSFPTTLGIDAFAHPWPNVSLYAFSAN